MNLNLMTIANTSYMYTEARYAGRYYYTQNRVRTKAV